MLLTMSSDSETNLGITLLFICFFTYPVAVFLHFLFWPSDFEKDNDEKL